MQSIQIEFSFWAFAGEGHIITKRGKADIEALGNPGNCNNCVDNQHAGLQWRLDHRIDNRRC